MPHSWFVKALSPRPRNVLAWLLAIGLAVTYLVNAWIIDGYFSCDFASQWLMGRMVVEGRGRELYAVPPQQEVLRHGYWGQQWEQMNEQILLKHPRDQEHSGVEGPLYPPTMGLLMAPVCLLEPRAACAVLILIHLQLCFVCAWLLRSITDGGLRMGEAAMIILLYPHVAMTVTLGQNAVFTLTIVLTGWALRQRGWLFTAGLVWGLLAYKPVFAVALVWVPLVLGNVRMFLGMIVGGALFGLATLPFCGFDLLVWNDMGMSLNEAHPWRRWLTVGANAALTYSQDPNWVWMSRDVISLPRRAMWNLDYTQEHIRALSGLIPWDEGRMHAVDESAQAIWIGRALLVGVVALTALAALAARLRRRTGGESPWLLSFVLLGGLLSTYHFIWYDLLPTVLPCALLLTQARQMGWLGRTWLMLLAITLGIAEASLTWGAGPFLWPIETFILLATWAWAGWRAVVESRPQGRSNV